MSTKKQPVRQASRVWGIIIPANWAIVEELLNFVRTLPKYYYILHDGDYTEDGELKKPHYHCLIDFGSSRNLSTVVGYFSSFSEFLKENSFERIISKVGSIRYLVHLG